MELQEVGMKDNVKSAILLTSLTVMGLYGAHYVTLLESLSCFLFYCILLSIVFSYILIKKSTSTWYCLFLWIVTLIPILWVLTFSDLLVQINPRINPIIFGDILYESIFVAIFVNVGYVLTVLSCSAIFCGFARIVAKKNLTQKHRPSAFAEKWVGFAAQMGYTLM